MVWFIFYLIVTGIGKRGKNRKKYFVCMDTKEMIGEDRLSKGLYWRKAWSLVDGCTHVSEACQNCWSERKDAFYNKERNFSLVVHRPDRLTIPEKTKKPTVFAVWNDLFHQVVPFEFISDAFTKMVENPQHRYIILSKRPERMLEWSKTFSHDLREQKHIWLGTTAENQNWADIRIPILLQVPAYIRLLSAEPLLGPISLKEFSKGIHWVIAGAESGSGFRETKKEWVRQLKDECLAFHILFFLKQMRNEIGILEKVPYLDKSKWRDVPLV